MEKNILAKFLLIFVVPAALINPGEAQSSRRSGYGEFCNTAIKCDKRAWLSCQHEQCDCIFLDEMIYDNSSSKCLSKSGERCKFQVGNPLADSGTATFYENSDCIRNGECGADGICSCLTAYYESIDGTCLPEKGYDRPCVDNVECSQASHFLCLNGTCDCTSAQILYESTNGSYCVGKAGLVVSGKSCTEDAIEVDGVCSCQPQYYSEEDGRCYEKQNYLGPCSNDSRCQSNIFLSCINGSCDCDESRFKYSNNTPAQCVGMSSMPCNANAACVENAICSSGDLNICSCLPNYYESMDGLCLPEKQYGAICTKDAECNQANHFSCINGTCDCTSAQLLKDSTDGSYCVGKAGLPFSGKSCVDGSVAIGGICVCTPQETFYAGEDGNCHEKKGIFGSCSDDNHCKSNSFLACLNATCVCASSKSKYRVFTESKTSSIPKSCVEVFRDSIKGMPWANYACHSISNDNIRCGINKCIPSSYLCDGDQDTGCDGLDEARLLCSFCDKGVGTNAVEEVVSTTGECAGLAAKSCSANNKCVEKSACVNGTCVCDTSYSASRDGTCGRLQGNSCSGSMKCSDNFVCSQAKCRCPSLKYQTYDSARNIDKCVSLIRGSCESHSDCLPHGICVSRRGSAKYRQCACPAGFVENSERKCDLTHGSNCTAENLHCDRKAQLECVDGLCACPDGLTHFDSGLRKCLGLAGTACSLSAQTSQVCVMNAQCILKYGDLDGSCFCNNGFNSTSTRFCEPVEAELNYASG